MERIEGAWYARAFQGHAKSMAQTLGPDFAPGEKLDTSRYRYVYHGMSSSEAGSIRQEGVLRGGVSGHRMHIHLTTRVRDGIDESTGEFREGVKGDAYVQIDAAEFLGSGCIFI